MSTFYGTLDGEKKPKTKQGQRHLSGHLRGWDHGIRIEYTLHDTGHAIIKRYKLNNISKRRPGSEYYGHVFGGVK